jgi:hypothetical protein
MITPLGWNDGLCYVTYIIVTNVIPCEVMYAYDIPHNLT